MTIPTQVLSKPEAVLAERPVVHLISDYLRRRRLSCENLYLLMPGGNLGTKFGANAHAYDPGT